jgi:hypothetical protein
LQEHLVAIICTNHRVRRPDQDAVDPTVSIDQIVQESIDCILVTVAVVKVSIERVHLLLHITWRVARVPTVGRGQSKCRKDK